MATLRPSPTTSRAELMFGGLSCAALVLATYAVMRPAAAAPMAAETEIASLRAELADLRHSLELTRSKLSAPNNGGAIAEVEQRLARVEASARVGTRPVPAASPDAAAGSEPDAPERMPDGSSRFVDLVPANGAVAVEQLANGSLVATNRDPSLAGQSMLVKARTADGREESVTITVPPPG